MDPSRRVQLLVLHYGGLEVLHPTIAELMGTRAHAEMFQRCVEQELKLLQSRSPNLDDHEISIIQKAFITLMASDDTQVGAAELYVEEIIGLKLVPSGETSGVLKTALDARTLLDSSAHVEQLASRRYEAQKKEEGLFLSPGSTVEAPESQQNPTSVSQGASQADKSDVKTEIPEPVTLPIPQYDFESDTNFTRLWHVFQTAREDFRSRGQGDRTNSARFLRDTAENVIGYIESRQPSAKDASGEEAQGLAGKLSELRTSLTEAVEIAKTRFGLKNRRLEHRKTDVPGKTRDSRQRSFPQEHVRQPEGTSRPAYSPRERSPHASHRPRRIRTRGTDDEYRPSYRREYPLFRPR